MNANAAKIESAVICHHDELEAADREADSLATLKKIEAAVTIIAAAHLKNNQTTFSSRALAIRKRALDRLFGVFGD